MLGPTLLCVGDKIESRGVQLFRGRRSETLSRAVSRIKNRRNPNQYLAKNISIEN